MAYYFDKRRDNGYTLSAFQFVSCSAIRGTLLLLRGEAMKYNCCCKILDQQLMPNVAIWLKKSGPTLKAFSCSEINTNQYRSEIGESSRKLF